METKLLAIVLYNRENHCIFTLKGELLYNVGLFTYGKILSILSSLYTAIHFKIRNAS